QMGDAKTFGDQPVTALDHVMVAVVRKSALEPVRGLARTATSERVLHDHKIFRRIKWLPRSEKLVGEARAQPVGAGAGVALQQQYAVDDLAGGVALCPSQGAVMQLQLGQGLAAAKHIVADDEVGLLIIRPAGSLGGR